MFIDRLLNPFCRRLWTFTMSCCISSAVCCSFVTASMSGIALGYNYSLAEYIDLKETNVSVYIKRGVFDDEIADDMDWRRSGHLPIAGHIGEKNLMTAAPAEDDAAALRSGRRLDDSMFESDDQNKFEGSLMKLTAKVPYATTTTKEVTSDQEMSDIISKYPLGSIDQLKAIQSLINMRKSGDARDTTAKDVPKSSTYGFDERYLPHFPAFPDPMAGGRRRMPENVIVGPPSTPNSARYAVPDNSINEPAKWFYPKLPPEDMNKAMYGDYDKSYTYPPPVTPRAGPLRPPKPTPTVFRARPTQTTKKVETTRRQIDVAVPKSIDRDLDAFKERLTLDKYEGPGVKDEDLRMPKQRPVKTDEDYDEDIKGLPVRRRRHVSVQNIHKDKTMAAIKEEGLNQKETTQQRQKDFKNTLINKFLIISSKVAQMSIDVTTSKNILNSRQEPYADQNIILNDIKLRTLLSPKNRILNLLQVTIA
ncbi:hypothetical protein O3G_MSEX003441 [Manduca sexta]|uniref:Uncharacterized protein n=1 Tax=Manduca sexta TaxID=7130 RepID=A0A922CFN4_MANSE|nr:hypothetical protein O3G_MSEX003441 [Manduca sexta]